MERQLIIVSFSFTIFAEDKSSFGLSCDTLFFRHIYINMHIQKQKNLTVGGKCVRIPLRVILIALRI